jgi:hypothetical protein
MAVCRLGGSLKDIDFAYILAILFDRDDGLITLNAGFPVPAEKIYSLTKKSQ